MECRRHRTGPGSDEIPRRRRTGLVRDNQTDLACGTGRPVAVAPAPAWWTTAAACANNHSCGTPIRSRSPSRPPGHAAVPGGASALAGTVALAGTAVLDDGSYPGLACRRHGDLARALSRTAADEPHDHGH